MSVQTVIRMGHPTLRQIGATISHQQIDSPQIRSLITDLIDTMTAYKGLGIAAPQIGISKQICILQIPKYNQRYGELNEFPLTVIINPSVTVLDQTTQGFWEGCLSVPGIKGYVRRPRKVRVNFLNDKGEKQQVIAQGIAAVVFQHEIDHLNGNLFIDKVENKKIAFLEQFNQFGIQKSESVLAD